MKYAVRLLVLSVPFLILYSNSAETRPASPLTKSSEALTAAPPLSSAARELIGMCQKIMAYERECGGTAPAYCRNGNQDIVEDFMELCGGSNTMTSVQCIEQVNRAFSDLFTENHIAPCRTTLQFAVAHREESVQVAQPPLEAVRPAAEVAQVCSYTGAQSRLICTVLNQCGNVAGEDVLRCWDRGTLTLRPGEVDVYRGLATDRKGRMRRPQELIDADGCLAEYCRTMR